jgi:hypothetical protein
MQRRRPNAPPRVSFARRRGCPSPAARHATMPCSSVRTRARRDQGARRAAARCGTIVEPSGASPTSNCELDPCDPDLTLDLTLGRSMERNSMACAGRGLSPLP